MSAAILINDAGKITLFTESTQTIVSPAATMARILASQDAGAAFHGRRAPSRNTLNTVPFRVRGLLPKASPLGTSQYPGLRLKCATATISISFSAIRYTRLKGYIRKMNLLVVGFVRRPGFWKFRNSLNRVVQLSNETGGCIRASLAIPIRYGLHLLRSFWVKSYAMRHPRSGRAFGVLLPTEPFAPRPTPTPLRGGVSWPPKRHRPLLATRPARSREAKSQVLLVP